MLRRGGPGRRNRRRRAAAAFLVVAEIAILFAGVVARYGFDNPLVWVEELAAILFLWLVSLGAVIALRRGEHMRMTVWSAARCPLAAPGRLLRAVLVAVVTLGLLVPGMVLRRAAGGDPDAGAAAPRLMGDRRPARGLAAAALRRVAAAAGRGTLDGTRRRAAGRRRRLRRAVVPGGLVRRHRQWQPAGVLHRHRRAVHLPRGADRVQLRHRDVRLHVLHQLHPAVGDPRPDGPGHVLHRAAGRADVRRARAAAGDDRASPAPWWNSLPPWWATDAAVCPTC